MLASLEKKPFLGINGIPFTDLGEYSGEFLVWNPMGNWEFSTPDLAPELDLSYVSIYDEVERLLWGSTSNFMKFHSSIQPHFENMLVDSGRNPESKMDKDEFNKIINRFKGHENEDLMFKFLYTFDIFSLISNIQELTSEVKFFCGEFYQILNLEPTFPNLPQKDKVGIRTSKSPVSKKLSGLLGLIFIRFHSLLDFHTKLAYEIFNIKTDFSRYPKLASSNILYGDTRRLALDNSSTENTLFFKDRFINQIESYRNELIHNSLLDDAPRAYERYENLEAVERYMLLPDVDESGSLKRFVNRRFFYSEENKFNQLLPEMLRTFQQRQLNTALLIQEISSRKEPNNES